VSYSSITRKAQAVAWVTVKRPPNVRLPPSEEEASMSKESKPLKPFAQTVREELRYHFARRAGEAPIPNPFDAESMREWEQYCEEMRNLETQLRAAGDSL